jgi:hypothetical protein
MLGLHDAFAGGGLTGIAAMQHIDGGRLNGE